ncbi:protein smoothened isoform X2 [Periplaneta americana]
MPKCENGTVDLPSQEMCKMTVGPCRILESYKSWPSFFRCDDTVRFPPMCKNDARELKYNTTSQCQSPLVPTDNTLAFYDGIEGCGIQCQNPLLTEDEHRQIHQLIAWAGTICLLFNIFTVVTFFIDWRSANKYPALVIFYINCCFLVSCIGWLAQFIPGAREGIICRKDGTLRMSEPNTGENLSCVIIFVLVYYFIMAAFVWFVILTYTWHISFQTLGKIQERIDKKSAYFHMVAWSLPLVLTITTMALGEIDGDSVAGICFVGYVNHAARAGFLLVPITTVLFVGGYFLTRGLITLVRLKINSQEIISERASAKIRETIVRMGLFSLFTFVFVLVTFVCHVYEFHHHSDWRESFRKFIVCRIMSSGNADTKRCKIESRPSLSMMQLHILVMFLAGVIMSSWVWTSSTVDTWRRCLRRTFNTQAEEPVRLKKHKVIAQAFAKRKTFNNAGRLSISFHSTHEDPVGLNFDMNSIASQDFSSTWAAALPKLMTRRGALIGVATGSNSSQHRNSIDSEISYSVRRVSVESRRHSLDSQVSVQIAEVTATRKAAATPMPAASTATVSGGRGRKTRSRRQRREFGRIRSSRVGPLLIRRGSTTSQESQLGAQILSALTLANTTLPSFVPNLKKRRTGNAGLDSSKVILPFALPDQSLDVSDEEQNSDEKISGTIKKFDIFLCREANDVDLEDINDSDEEISDGMPAENDMKVVIASKFNEDENDDRNDDINNKRKNRSTEINANTVSANDGIHIEEDQKNSIVDMGSHHSISAEVDDYRSRTSEGNRYRNNYGDCKNINIPDEVKLYLTEGSDDEPPQKLNFVPSVDIGGVSDGSTSFCPELSHLVVQSSHSGLSQGSPHNFDASKTRVISVTPYNQSNNEGREVGTQTTLSIDCIEMQELKGKNIIHPSPRACASQSTRVSPPSSRPSVPRSYSHGHFEKNQTSLVNKIADNVLSSPAGRALNYSYNVQRLVQELSEGSHAGPPVRPERRKSAQGKNSVRSKSADNKNVELQWNPVAL